MQPVSVVGTPIPATTKSMAKIMQRSWVAFVIALLQLGSAITLICLTRYAMEAIIYTPTNNATVVWGYTCFLSSNLSAGPCQYSYALGAVSLILSMCLFTMQCVQCQDFMSRSTRACEGVVDLLGFAWWLAGSIVLQLEVNKVNAMKVTLPNSSYRSGILAMCWLSTALFLVMLLFTIGTAVRVGRVAREHDAVGTAAKPVPLHPPQAPEASAV